jgi:hypothetical protein
LRLTPEQQKQWQALEATIRDLAKVRIDRREEFLQRRSGERNANQRVDIATRLNERAQCLKAGAENVETFARAAKPLLEVLDEGQTRRFGLLLLSASRRRARVRRGARLTRFIRRCTVAERYS